MAATGAARRQGKDVYLLQHLLPRTPAVGTLKVTKTYDAKTGPSSAERGPRVRDRRPAARPAQSKRSRRFRRRTTWPVRARVRRASQLYRISEQRGQLVPILSLSICK